MVEPVYGAAFPDPFPGQPRPTPDEITGLSTDQAIISGINSGLDKKLIAQAQVEMDALGNTMDGFMEQLARALEEELSAAQWINQDMNEKALSFIVSGLLPAIETGIGLAGFQPAGAPGQGKGGKAPRKRKPPQAPSQAACVDFPIGNPIAFTGGPPAVKPGDTFDAVSPVEGSVTITVDRYEPADCQTACNVAVGHEVSTGKCYYFNIQPSGPVPGGIVGPPLAPPPPPGAPPAPPAPRPPAPAPPAPAACCPETLTIQCQQITIQADSVETPSVDVTIDQLDVNAPCPAPAPPVDKKACFTFFANLGLEVPRAADPLPNCNPTDVRAAYGDFLDRAIAAGAGEGTTIQNLVACGLCKGPVALGFTEPERDTQCGPDGLPVNPFPEGGFFSDWNRFQAGVHAWQNGRTPTPLWNAAQQQGYDAAKACGLKFNSGAAYNPKEAARCQLPPPLGSSLGGDLGDCLRDGRATLANMVGYVEAFLKRQCAGGTGSMTRALFDWGNQAASEGGVKGFFGGLARDVATMFQCLDCFGVSLEPWIAAAIGCPGAPVAGMILFDTLVGIWERWVGKVPSKLYENILRLGDFLCPTDLPSEADARRAWLKGQLTDGLWECVVRSHNQRPDMAALCRDAERETITPDEALILARRGALTMSRNEADSAAGGLAGLAIADNQRPALERVLRRHGFTTPEDINLFLATQQWIPEPAEGIEWMLKDLGDPQIADRFGLWNEFKLKYRGHVKEVMDWHGIQEIDARHLAAAHLQSVAPTQLYEMHKRLRPGFERRLTDDQAVQFALAISPQKPRGPGAEDELASIAEWQGSPTYTVNVYPGTENWQALGYPATPPYWREDITTPHLARAYLANLVTTGGIVYEGLSQARYPTFWRERLEAISYRVLTRVDARRAYEVGQISLPELVEILQDQGYDQVGADRLGAFYYENLVRTFAGSVASNQWVSEGFSLDKLYGVLRDRGMRPEMWPDVLPRLERRRALQIERECLKAIKKRFLSGHLDEQGATNQLMAIHFTSERIADIITEWNCLKRAKPRSEVAAQVCKELTAEIIPPDTAKRLLRSAGFTATQASRIVRACVATAATHPDTRRGLMRKLMKKMEEIEPGSFPEFAEQQKVPVKPGKKRG